MIKTQKKIEKIVIIPDCGREEIHNDWKNVLKKCYKNSEKEFDYYLHKDSSSEKKLILLDGRHERCIISAGEIIQDVHNEEEGSFYRIDNAFWAMDRRGGSIIKYGNFLKDLAHRSNILIIDGATYVEDKDVKSYNSCFEKAIEDKKMGEIMKDKFPALWEKMGENKDFCKLPMSREGVNYASYGKDRIHRYSRSPPFAYPFRPAICRLEESFDKGFQAMKEYSEYGEHKPSYSSKEENNWDTWREKWSNRNDREFSNTMRALTTSFGCNLFRE